MKRKSFLLCLVFTMTILFSAFAETGLTVNYDKTSEVLTIGGGAVYAPGSSVSLLVLSPGKGLGDVRNDGQANDDKTVWFAQQKSADRFGGISFSVSMKDAPKGIYTIYVASDDGSDTFTTTYSMVPGTFEAEFLNQINAVSKSEDMETLLTGEDAKIFLKEPGYPSPSDKTAVYDYMVKNRPYTSFAEINATYGEAYLAALFAQTKTADEVAAFVEAYGVSGIGLDSNPQMYTLYSQSKLKTQINANAAGFKADSLEALRGKIYDETILTTVEKTDNWSSLTSVINGADTYLKDVDYTRYRKYADKINKQIGGKQYETIAMLQTAINTVDVSSGTGGSGNGGNSGNSSTGSSTPVVKPGTIVVPPSEQLPGGGTEQEIILFQDQASIPAYAKAYLPSLKMNNIITGDTEGNFNPDNNLTRAELAKVLVCALNPETEAENMDFSDVKADDWFYPYVSKAIAAGYFKGMDESYFGANEPISRQDMAVVMERICQMRGVEVPPAEPLSYLDGDAIADYASAAVETMGKLELMIGSDSWFGPRDNLTRAQAVKIIGKLLYELS